MLKTFIIIAVGFFYCVAIFLFIFGAYGFFHGISRNHKDHADGGCLFMVLGFGFMIIAFIANFIALLVM